MDTIGWLLILGGALLMRGVVNGRGFDSFTDLSDAFIATIEGDSETLKSVWNRKGSNNSADEVAVPPPSTFGGTTTGQGGGVPLVNEMKRIGLGKSYSQKQRTGPDSFDCSGLVWKAGTDLGIWPNKTPVFTTASFKVLATTKFALTKVPQVAAGDIVWWPGHMGVATDNRNFFSALSAHRAAGHQIDTVPIASITNHGKPTFYRFVSTPT
jgi:cell wall-associated NlpC family hydrolase